MPAFKKLVLASFLLLGIVLGIAGTRSGILPPRVYAQGSAQDAYAIFSGTTAVSPGTIVAAVTGKRVYVKSIIITSAATAPISICDGTTAILSIPCLAGVPTILGPDFFVGGPGLDTSWPVTSSSAALKVQQGSTSNAVYMTVRYVQQ